VAGSLSVSGFEARDQEVAKGRMRVVYARELAEARFAVVYVQDGQLVRATFGRAA
jgi:hypothetical protein